MNPLQKLTDRIDSLTDEAKRRTLDEAPSSSSREDGSDGDDGDDADSDDPDTDDEDTDRDSDADGPGGHGGPGDDHDEDDADEADSDDEDGDEDDGDDEEDGDRDDDEDDDGDGDGNDEDDDGDGDRDDDEDDDDVSDGDENQRDDGERGDGSAEATDPTTDGDHVTAASSESSPDDSGERSDDAWSEIDTDVEKTLYAACGTDNGVYAVGASGTVARRSRDGSWSIVVPSGPAAKRNTLTCVTVTDDRKRIWFAGSSGSLGMYDTTTGRKYDYSAPMEKTSTWEAIGIAGERGEETLVVANGSGEVMEASVNESFCPSFSDPVKPGSGSTIPALDVCNEVVYAVDTSGNVFEREGEEWTRVGIENAQINFTDVDVSADSSALVSGGGGIVYRYDALCENWTPIAVGTVVLRGMDRDGERVVVVGDGGRVYERDPREGWRPSPAATESTLHAVALGETDVAVGEGGAVVERHGGRGGESGVSEA